MWPEIPPPPEPHERGIEELTGVRPYKGTLMYYRQRGIYDPYDVEEEPEQYPGQRTSDIIYYLEQSHHEHSPGRQKPSHTLLGQRVQTHTKDTFRPQAPRKGGKRQQGHPEQSRELVGPPRPGRATELFLQGRARADHHIVDESNVCPSAPRSRYKPGPKFKFKQSPWNAASQSYIGDPRDAFEENRPPEIERLGCQPPAKARIHAPANKPRPGYSEMDYARPQHQSSGGQFHQHMHHQQQQQQVQQSSSWKGNNQPRAGESYKRFHANVVPYETDFNRKATGWSSNYVHEDPTDSIFRHDDLDAYQSPSFSSGGGGGGNRPGQFGDYNPRPTAWQGGQEEEEEPYVPLNQRRANYEQTQQQAYHQHHQQQQRAQQQRPPQRGGGGRGRGGPRQAPRGRGSAAYQPNYAGPQQSSWGGGDMFESDDL
ncbi:uncharacterized protein [Amphiura filiformis]|uniref:uncharacterized protein n=1 Tax=Amphiura filiformis TaxID=82378 RepID=UPI003B228312